MLITGGLSWCSDRVSDLYAASRAGGEYDFVREASACGGTPAWVVRRRISHLRLVLQCEENKEQYLLLRGACFDFDDEGNDRLASDVVYGLHYIYFGEETGAGISFPFCRLHDTDKVGNFQTRSSRSG